VSLTVIGQMQHRRFSPGSPQPDGLAAADYQPTEMVDTFGWYPASSDDVGLDAGRRPVTCDTVLMVPAGTVCGDQDQWVLPDGGYVQQGRPGDYNNGPFGMAVPLLVYLKRVEG